MYLQKNVKTIIFSELPQQDKIKYFNFLLENDINFSRDESGNYVALVKVLNPAFYGGAQNTSNKTTIDKQKKTTSKINTIDSKKEIPEQKKPEKANKVVPKTNNISENNNIQYKEEGSYLRGKKKNEQFEKEKKPAQRKSFLDSFEGRYKKFIELVNPLVGIRGKRMNINELKYCIEEIYSIRFINDSNKDNEDQYFPFPNFVLEFLNNKYIKKPAVDQHSLDLILSIDFFRARDPIVDIFSKFLNEELDNDDLEFYLYVRFCIEKELNKTFIELSRQKKGKITEEEKESNSLSIKSCLNLANNIYGDEQEELLNSFMNKIEEILTEQKNKGMKKNLIPIEQILTITLNDYHQNKINNPNINRIIKSNNKTSSYENNQKNQIEQNISNMEEKKSNLKLILNSFIKEKELDIFFEKLLTSYTVHEKSKNNVEEILASIKDLVSKKVNLLIKILFDQDEKGWFNSLKLKEDDKDAKEYYVKLTGMIQEMLQFENLQDIPENMVETFGETLLLTPELNSQIIKLVLKKFE